MNFFSWLKRELGLSRPGNINMIQPLTSFLAWKRSIDVDNLVIPAGEEEEEELGANQQLVEGRKKVKWWVMTKPPTSQDCNINIAIDLVTGDDLVIEVLIFNESKGSGVFPSPAANAWSGGRLAFGGFLAGVRNLECLQNFNIPQVWVGRWVDNCWNLVLFFAATEVMNLDKFK